MHNLLIICGFIGGALCLFAYYKLTKGHWHKYSKSYLYVTLLGCVGLTLSLIVQFNIAALFINVAWASICVYSLITKQNG